jgi:hypothetical protein
MWYLVLSEAYRLGAFESRVLRRIFEIKRDDETWEWRRLHTGEPYDLYSSPDVIRVIKSRRIRWAWHIARIWREMHAGYC